MKINYELIKLIFMMAYATGVTAGAFYFFFNAVFSPIPEDNIQNANIILGFLMGTCLTVFIQYFFGNSQSTSAAAKKDAEKDPMTEAAKSEAAMLESERIEAAQKEAEKKETARLKEAKEAAAKVIEEASEEVKAGDTL